MGSFFVAESEVFSESAFGSLFWGRSFLGGASSLMRGRVGCSSAGGVGVSGASTGSSTGGLALRSSWVRWSADMSLCWMRKRRTCS